MTCIKRKSFRGPSLWWWRAVSLRPRGSHVLLALPCSGDQIVGATIYFDNLQSGEVTQLLNTMGHHTVGLKLHRKGDRSPEPGQTWTHEVFSSRSSEVVLVSAWPACLCSELPLATLTCSPLSEPCVCLYWTSLVVPSPTFAPVHSRVEPDRVFLCMCGMWLTLPLKVSHRSLQSAAVWEPTHAVWPDMPGGRSATLQESSK